MRFEIARRTDLSEREIKFIADLGYEKSANNSYELKIGEELEQSQLENPLMIDARRSMIRIDGLTLLEYLKGRFKDHPGVVNLFVEEEIITKQECKKAHEDINKWCVNFLRDILNDLSFTARQISFLFPNSANSNDLATVIDNYRKNDSDQNFSQILCVLFLQQPIPDQDIDYRDIIQRVIDHQDLQQKDIFQGLLFFEQIAIFLRKKGVDEHNYNEILWSIFSHYNQNLLYSIQKALFSYYMKHNTTENQVSLCTEKVEFFWLSRWNYYC